MNLGVNKQVSKAWLFIPPLAFLLKDIVATIAVLSREPGITANAASYYAMAMLPGALISGESAMLINVSFGVLVGVTLYFALRWSRTRKSPSGA